MGGRQFLLTDCAVREQKLRFDHVWISLDAATCVDLWTLVHLTEASADVIGWNVCVYGRMEEYAPGKCGMGGGSLVRVDPQKHKRRWLFSCSRPPALLNAW